MKITVRRLALLGSLLTVMGGGSFPGVTRAEESGSGHYLAGATSSFIDLLPDRETPTFAYLNAFAYYHGTADAGDVLKAVEI